MRFAASILVAGLLVLASGCGDSDRDHVSWTAEFDASESSGTETGGATVQARGTLLTLPGSRWSFDLPVPFAGETPATDLAALGHAVILSGSDRQVIDAVASPQGVVALLEDPAGETEIALLTAIAGQSALVPAGGRRLVLAGDDPLRVWILLSDGTAVLATLLP